MFDLSEPVVVCAKRDLNSEVPHFWPGAAEDFARRWGSHEAAS